jgi:hypothetical protein
MASHHLDEDAPRAALPWVGSVTVALLVLCEQYAEVPAAVAAFAAARWVFGLRPASSRRR